MEWDELYKELNNIKIDFERSLSHYQDPGQHSKTL